MSSPGVPARSRLRTAINITAISALGTTAGSSLVVVGAARDSLAAGYHSSLASLAWLTAALSVSYALMQIPAGWLVDRWGPRRVAYWGAAGSLAAYAAAMLTPDFTLAVVLRVVVGATAALGFVAGSDLVRAVGLPSWVQGLFGGIALGSGGVAFLVLPALSSTAVSWRSPWLFEVVLAVIAVVALLSIPRTPPRHSAHVDAPRPKVISARLLAFGAAHTATFGLGVVLSNWLAVQLISHGGLDTSWADLITAVLLIVTAVSRPLGGYLFDRTHDLRLVIVGPLIIGALTLVALSLPLGAVAALICAIVFGVFSGIPFAPSFESARRLVPHAPGVAIGVVNGLANAVILGGVPAYILMIDAGQGALALWLMAGFWVFSALAVVRTRDPE